VRRRLRRLGLETGFSIFPCSQALNFISKLPNVEEKTKKKRQYVFVP
jgi:hypothetical protein